MRRLVPRGVLPTRAWIERDGLTGLATFAVAIAIYSLTASWTRVHNSDVYAAVIPAIQTAATGVPWLEETRWVGTSPFFVWTGEHLVTNRPVGVVLLAVPFYALVGAPAAVWPSALAAATATAGTVTMLHLAVRKVARPLPAAAATAVFAFGTPTWTVSADGLWGHTATQFSIAAAALALARERWWIAGVALGAGVLARPHLAVIALVLGLGLTWAKRSVWPTLCVGLPAVAGLVMTIGANQWLYGRWTLTGYDSYTTDNLASGFGSLTDRVVNVAGFLVAPDRGLFIWTPILLLLLPSLYRVRRTAPPWTTWLALGGVGYTLVQLRMNHFHGVDAFFGYRHGLELVTSAFPILTVAWDRERSRGVRGWVAGLAVVQVASMSLGAVRSDGFLNVDEVWRDNTILYVLRWEPTVMVPLALFVLAVALRIGWSVRAATSTGRAATTPDVSPSRASP